MSHNPYHARRQSLLGAFAGSCDETALRGMFRDILQQRIHGISFSPYIEGQGPGTVVSEQQIRDRLSLVAPYVDWIRTFSCTDGNELIPAIASEMGLKCLVGAWLDADRDKNEQELAGAIEVARQGNAGILGIGNEVLLREELTEDELVDYVTRAREAVAGTGVEVGYVDAYYEFELNPKIADACDVILANCYPFWEGCAAEYSLLYMKDMYRRAQVAARGKKVIITETGWPNIGSPEGPAIPGTVNAIKYFVETQQWVADTGIELFYFSSFDESWKDAVEGDVGAFWGIMDANGELKYA